MSENTNAPHRDGPAYLQWNGIRAGYRFHNGLFMDQVRATADVFSCLFTSPAWIPHFRFITVLAQAVFPLDECRSVDKCLVPLTQICAPA